MIAVVDGERFAVMPPARDYKRLRDGDQGPNTGGMGSYAPVHDLDPDVMARVRESVLEPAVAGLRAEGRPYRGALYAGLMLTSEGPMALEFNCRFGDPETQVILPLLDLDLAELLLACAEGRLATESVATHPDVAVCVVLAAEGYPERPRAGDPIHGIEDALQPGRSSSTLEQVSAMGGSSQAVAEFSRWSGRAPIWPRRRCVPTRRRT